MNENVQDQYNVNDMTSHYRHCYYYSR